MTIAEKIQTALSQFPDHAATERLRAEVAQLKEDELKHWAKLMDASEHSLEEWISAIIAFNLWLDREKRQIDLFNRIEYLSCCAEGGIQTGGMLTLTDLFHDYVKLYGVE
jgi:hypothetical protein